MFLAFILLQSAQPAAIPPPDIQLDLRVTARRVTIERRGRTSLELRGSVNGREGQGNLIDVRAPELPPGQTRLENVDVHVRGEARIPAPENLTNSEEQARPQ